MANKIVMMIVAFAFVPVGFAADRNCQLVKAEEANAVFGTSLRAGKPALSDDGKAECQYAAAETLMVTGVVDHNGRSAFSAQRSSLADNPGRLENVAGLGDEALVQVFSSGGGLIAVRRGEAFFLLAISGRKAMPVKEGLIQLARKALTRL